MCGIAGCSSSLIKESPELVLKKMGEALYHRGPDDFGYFRDERMALAHRRLSIIDLSSKGRQPMVSQDKKSVIVFNGEIYNFHELRGDLENKGHSFLTKTDTEVLLQLYMEKGIDALHSIRGMFAFAIWNTDLGELLLCRDRIGKKPLYYYFDGRNIAFASEIKSILQIPNLRTDIDYTSLVDYLKYLYIPHPKSIYKNIFKLEPGHYLIFKNGKIDVKQYWDINFSNELDNNHNEISDQLLSLISDSVKIRLISDVPLGAFLSGGIDSSGVVALMAKSENAPVKTCTIGFDDSLHNEAIEAKKFADQWKTEHHEYYIDGNESVGSILRKLVWHLDEPFADSSMIPTYHVCRMAKRIVTVALSGDGGDENYGGYEKYSIDFIENQIRRFIPGLILKMMSTVFRDAERGVGKKILSLSSSAQLSPEEGYYMTNTFMSDRVLLDILSDQVKKNVTGYNPLEHTLRYYKNANTDDHVSRLLYTDLKSYLPGDILVKVDRMSMANSLEVRSPLLDHKVIEFAAGIPSVFKVKGRRKKIILKEALESILPSELMRRRKHGFDAPIDRWLRKEIKSMAYDYYFTKDYMHNFFNVSALKEIWNRHQHGQADLGTNLWTLLLFSIWYDEFINSGSGLINN